MIPGLRGELIGKASNFFYFLDKLTGKHLGSWDRRVLVGTSSKGTYQHRKAEQSEAKLKERKRNKSRCYCSVLLKTELQTDWEQQWNLRAHSFNSFRSSCWFPPILTLSHTQLSRRVSLPRKPNSSETR